MQVAVFTGRHMDGIDAKFGFRFFTGFEKFFVAFAVGKKFNPLDIVSFFHGMGNRADTDLPAGSRLFQHGHMFFFCPVAGSLGHVFHIFATAHQRRTAAMHHFHDIAAMHALVHFKLMSH